MSCSPVMRNRILFLDYLGSPIRGLFHERSWRSQLLVSASQYDWFMHCQGCRFPVKCYKWKKNRSFCTCRACHFSFFQRKVNNLKLQNISTINVELFWKWEPNRLRNGWAAVAQHRAQGRFPVTENRPFCTCRACHFSLNRKVKWISRLIYAHHDHIELIWKGHEDQGSTRAARPKNVQQNKRFSGQPKTVPVHMSRVPLFFES